MHPEDIKAELKKKGSSLAAIAKELDLAASTVSHVIQGARSRRVEKRIAQVLGLPLTAVWPARYGRLKKSTESRK